jgi:hypothetical protein
MHLQVHSTLSVQSQLRVFTLVLNLESEEKWKMNGSKILFIFVQRQRGCKYF